MSVERTKGTLAGAVAVLASSMSRDEIVALVDESFRAAGGNRLAALRDACERTALIEVTLDDGQTLHGDAVAVSMSGDRLFMEDASGEEFVVLTDVIREFEEVDA